jgi:hypothetical protein
VKFQLYEIDDLSGIKTKIYSPMLGGEGITLFEKFIDENNIQFPDEVTNLYDRLEIIGHDTGLWLESFDTNSGRFEANICTFKDLPGRFLRLFFTEFGVKCIVLGSGGLKPKSAIKRQEIPKLNSEVELLERISMTLQKALKNGRIEIDDEGYIVDLQNGDLIFNL